MDHDLLKTFVEVSKTKHFGKAAENLYLTQAAISARIRLLESQLGVQLFTRQRNNIHLTPAGERLRPLADASLMLDQRIKQEVAISEEQQQLIAIGATPNIWDAFLQNELGGLFTRFPGMAMRAEAHAAMNIARQLLERTLDIAITFDAPKVDEIRSIELLDIPLHLVCSQKDSQWQQAFAGNYVLVDWGTAFNVQHAKTFRDVPSPILKTNTGRIALDFLLSNGGAAYLPESLVQPYLETRQLHRVTDAPVITRTAYASMADNPERHSDYLQLIDAIKHNEALAPESLTP